jgi:enoyl-CoA hydratase/carnithine racemase
MGILPGAGGTARLPRLLGRSRALDLILTARDVGPEEALSIGWLDAVLPSQTLLEHVDGVARRIATMPPASVAAVKEVVDVSLGRTVEEALVAESAALARLMAGDTHREPMRRFLDGGGQTREGETRRWPAIVERLLDG